MPNQQHVRAALERAELVVVQEAFRGTDTTSYADLLLPAASWGEKDGTVTNSNAASPACVQPWLRQVRRGMTGRSPSISRTAWVRSSAIR